MAESAASIFLERAARYGERPALCALAAGGAARDERLSWAGWRREAECFAAALLLDGVRPGDRVAVFAGNRMLWPVSDLGIQLAGAVGVGVYPTSAPGQVREVLADAGAGVAVVDTAERLRALLSVRDALPDLRTIICQDAVDLAHAGGGVVPWGGWQARGAGVLDVGDAASELARRVEGQSPDDVALLIYTSGSTGTPKGAAISHRYLLGSALSIQQVLGLSDTDTALSFLPYCHAAERVFGLYTRIVCGMGAGLVEDHGRIWSAARDFAPTLFGGLPRHFEKAFEQLRAEQLATSGEPRARWDRAESLGRQRSLLRRAGAAVPAALEDEWRRVGRPYFARLRSLFGGRLRTATSGGAALPAEVAEYLDALGLTVLGAYGLTEHLCVAFNRPERYAFDSAGPPMPGTELRFAGDGEILLRRGPLTFSGYHGRPDETAEAFTPDGEWLRTGDLGTLDARGGLRITGRKKELIALSTGKKIAPLPIEALLTRDPLLAQAVVYGEGRKFAAALLCLRRPVAEAWAREHGILVDAAALAAHPALRDRVQATVDAVNAMVSSPERIRAWTLLDRELSAEEDELTPTLKIRRSQVAEKFRDRLEALYR
jgi:long-chain acyl-CoA synthetase